MPHLRPLQPPGWLPPKGYANGIAARIDPGSQLIFTGGQIGWNAEQRFESDDFIAQCRQTLLNVRAVLEAAGAGPEHMCRMNWYIIDRDEYHRRLRELGTVYREVMGKHYPAMACLEVSALMEARARVEIEVTAIVPAAS
ncbi:RidA family protein [Tepidicella xavieri]|jgi:enamine deaminase RidA (YjgF/YER057c/UK114 family)|uniref:Enamine deaminase RidA (YjgF/YER057c/UK114 family) n=1 Tax=Tepidicella xavieri TaxID=360241 RepID=A0A4R6UH44_9BURK|nr:RidA family protein [Tepidicella xavieri]TDQ44285.1 enamine deaminase RidA (YjgF/YER057c/UK114 family) [Tepidicella xavieri]